MIAVYIIGVLAGIVYGLTAKQWHIFVPLAFGTVCLIGICLYNFPISPGCH
jgi:hypothetical protein